MAHGHNSAERHLQWTVMVPRLEQLAKTTRSCKEIADALNEEFNENLTRMCIVGKIRRLNLRPKQKQPPPKPPLKPPPMVAPAMPVNHGLFAPLAGCHPVEIMALQHQHCRWPIDTDHGVMYCGVPRNETAYCVTHARIARHGSHRGEW
jgi:hypothetical protein